MVMTFIPESFRAASESFDIVTAVIVAVLTALVITGFWEYAIQEVKLKRVELKRGRRTATSQNIESDRDRGRGNGIDVGGGGESATNAKSVQSSMRHFARAVEQLQILDGNRMADNSMERVTQDLVSDLRRIWSARSLEKANAQGSKDLPEWLHGTGSKKERRWQQGQRRYR